MPESSRRSSGTMLGKGPEGFDTIGVAVAADEPIVSMMDSEMFDVPTSTKP